MAGVYLHDRMGTWCVNYCLSRLFGLYGVRLWIDLAHCHTLQLAVMLGDIKRAQQGMDSNGWANLNDYINLHV